MSDPIKINSIDFSRFHALDHHWWEPYCRTQYGGIRTHARYWWEFIGSYWLHRNTSCRFGYHHYVHWFTTSEVRSSGNTCCLYCGSQP